MYHVMLTGLAAGTIVTLFLWGLVLQSFLSPPKTVSVAAGVTKQCVVRLEECLTKVGVMTFLGSKPCEVNADCHGTNYLGECDSADGVCLSIMIAKTGERKSHGKD